MGWWLTAADLPTPAPETDHSLTTALIAAIGAVLVALITIGLPLLRRPAAADEPAQEPRLGERIAAGEARDEFHSRTLEQLDRYVHGMDDDHGTLRAEHERLRWEFDDFKARVTEHMRRHGSP